MFDDNDGSIYNIEMDTEEYVEKKIFRINMYGGAACTAGTDLKELQELCPEHRFKVDITDTFLKVTLIAPGYRQYRYINISKKSHRISGAQVIKIGIEKMKGALALDYKSEHDVKKISIK